MSSDHRKEFRHGTIGALSIALLFLVLLAQEIPTAEAQPANPSPNENPYMDAKLTPSMAIIIVVLIAAMFFMGFFSIYIRHCSRSGSGAGGSIRAVVGAVAGRSRRSRGLDEEALQALPTFAYSEVKGLKIGKGALECAVCLVEFDDEETLRLLPKCDHVFHAECIDAWFASHTTCPVCRANLAAAAAAADSDSRADAGDNSAEIVDPESDDRRSETSDLHSDASVVVPVAVVADDERDRRGETAILPPRPPPARSWSMKKPRFFARFPRSHSTGHSLVQPGEDCERFTLRLPQVVRKQLVNRSMNRAAGLVMLPREGSSRRGYRTGGDGSSRGGRSYRRLDRLDRVVKSDRWVITAAPPFFSRASSLRSPRVAADGGEGSGSSSLLTAVKTPLNCLGSKGHDDAESASGETARLPV